MYPLFYNDTFYNPVRLFGKFNFSQMVSKPLCCVEYVSELVIKEFAVECDSLIPTGMGNGASESRAMRVIEFLLSRKWTRGVAVGGRDIAAM